MALWPHGHKLDWSADRLDVPIPRLRVIAPAQWRLLRQRRHAKAFFQYRSILAGGFAHPVCGFSSIARCARNLAHFFTQLSCVEQQEMRRGCERPLKRVRWRSQGGPSFLNLWFSVLRAGRPRARCVRSLLAMD